MITKKIKTEIIFKDWEEREEPELNDQGLQSTPGYLA